MPPTLAERLELLDLLERSERIDALIAMAQRFRAVPERLARRPFPAERRVPGCESEAFVWSEPRPDGTLDFFFAVENPQGISAKALATLLAETLSGAALAAVLSVPGDLVERLFGRELSLGKALGLRGLVAALQSEARAQQGRLATAAAGAPNR